MAYCKKVYTFCLPNYFDKKHELKIGKKCSIFVTHYPTWKFNRIRFEKSVHFCTKFVLIWWLANSPNFSDLSERLLFQWNCKACRTRLGE